MYMLSTQQNNFGSAQRCILSDVLSQSIPYRLPSGLILGGGENDFYKEIYIALLLTKLNCILSLYCD